MNFEKVKIPNKKTTERESRVNFFFFEEHPSSKIMCMKRRKHVVIPQITSTKHFPNISQLQMNIVNSSDDVVAVRENYAKMALLLFYLFRARSDLTHNGSFWERYRLSIHDRTFWPKGLEILQNIQDINYNCAQLQRPVDPITATTTLRTHEDDKDVKRLSETEENTVTIDHIEALLDSIDTGVSNPIGDPDINKRRLKHIAERVEVPTHTITNCTA